MLTSIIQTQVEFALNIITGLTTNHLPTQLETNILPTRVCPEAKPNNLHFESTQMTTRGILEETSSSPILTFPTQLCTNTVHVSNVLRRILIAATIPISPMYPREHEFETSSINNNSSRIRASSSNHCSCLKPKITYGRCL
jgi:hypothetical protein